jgi:hypothetical protein
MRKKSLTCFIILVLIAGLTSSCNFRPEALKGLFATSTLTFTPTPPATATPTSTATPTVTSTPTETPEPAINLTPCAFARYCPESTNIIEFVSGETVPGQIRYVTIPYDAIVTFHTGWLAKDESTLEENIKHLKFILQIDGQDYYDERFTARDLAYPQDDPYTGYPAIFTGIMTTGWKVGEVHSVTIGFEFTGEVFDGWDTYPAGTRYVFFYEIQPMLKPTSTPTSTPTATPRPRPTAVPVTPTPACERSGSVSIKNDTGGQVTLYLAGPYKFTFYIAAGSQTISICPGSYSYTAYGCGGASRTGSVSDGDEIEFWCQ